MYYLLKEKFLFRWFFVAQLFDIAYANIPAICQFVFKYIFRREGKKEELKQFTIESDNIFFDLKTKPTFDDFQSAYMEEGIPVGAILISNRENCRQCERKLLLDTSWKTVVIYHLTRGTYLGCRLTKKCNKCKIYEHYGFYSKDGTRMFDKNFKENEFLLSTENTAIDMNILLYFKQEFVQGAMPFKSKATVYNMFHGYTDGSLDEFSDEETDLQSQPPTKKKRRCDYARNSNVLLSYMHAYGYTATISCRFSRGFPNIFVHDSYTVMRNFEKLLYSLGS